MLYKFEGFHEGHIKTLTWNEDDSGFVTTGIDRHFGVWQLPKLKPEHMEHKIAPVWKYEQPLFKFYSTCIIKVETEF